MTDDKINVKDVNDVTNAGAQAASDAGLTATSAALSNDSSPSPADAVKLIGELEVRFVNLESRLTRLIQENFRTAGY